MEVKGNISNLNLNPLHNSNFKLVSQTLAANNSLSDRSSQLASPDELFNSVSKLDKGTPFDKPLSFTLDKPVETKTINKSNEKVMGISRGTSYYPANTKMEGGFKDKRGNKLNTLQGFLAGKSPYVSIALDKKLYQKGIIKYGDTFRIPELEKKYGRQIIFKAVDTGSAFTDKGFSRVDVCTASRKDSLDPTINGKLTLIKVT